MKKTTSLAAVGALTGLLALTGCGADKTVHIVGYSVLQEPNEKEIAAFQATDAGKDITFDTSYGASGAQRDAVINGQAASEVHLSLEPDVQKLVDAGLVDAGWKDNDTKGICTDSVVVFVVRKDNPNPPKTWQDIIDDGDKVVTPNPASSGSAKWNQLAAYGSVIADGGSEQDASDYMAKFFKQVAALPDSGSDATSSFMGGTGDVLISYENEAIKAIAGGADFSYVVPDNTLLIENPCAVTKDAPEGTQAFMDFQKSAAGQKVYAETGYRPLPGVDVGDVTVTGANDPTDAFPAPTGKLETIDADFGGWSAANTKFFDADNGILTKLQAANVATTN